MEMECADINEAKESTTNADGTGEFTKTDCARDICEDPKIDLEIPNVDTTFRPPSKWRNVTKFLQLGVASNFSSKKTNAQPMDTESISKTNQRSLSKLIREKFAKKDGSKEKDVKDEEAFENAQHLPTAKRHSLGKFFKYGKSSQSKESSIDYKNIDLQQSKRASLSRAFRNTFNIEKKPKSSVFSSVERADNVKFDIPLADTSEPSYGLENEQESPTSSLLTGSAPTNEEIKVYSDTIIGDL